MGKLMNYLYPLGYALPVVPEVFKCLTVGGLIAGRGLEKSSTLRIVSFNDIYCTCIRTIIKLDSVTEEKEPEYQKLFQMTLDHSRRPYEYYTNKTKYTIRVYLYNRL